MGYSITDIKSLISTIKQIAQGEISNSFGDIEKNIYGTIISSNSDKTFNVSVAGTNGTYNNIPNKSGETLSVGQTVVIKAINGNAGNGYIDKKKGTTPMDGTNIIERVYPVGAIYMATVSTNPADVFGFGTWVAYATGKTLIGVGTSDATYNFGETSLGQSAPTMPNHSHSVTGTAVETTDLVGAAWNMAAQSSTVNIKATGICAPGTRSEGVGYAVNTHTEKDGFVINANHEHSISGIAETNSSGDQVKGNLPPYVVTYMWQRTA